ncbi:dipeptidyl peptidase IV N-terminal region-domain-containing protein [Entophlyctis helioformis]|nr:dipeptidyl peptidase IV N-terminal region-domain-containing protein [Entophlyctis helioformis]
MSSVPLRRAQSYEDDLEDPDRIYGTEEDDIMLDGSGKGSRGHGKGDLAEQVVTDGGGVGRAKARLRRVAGGSRQALPFLVRAPAILFGLLLLLLLSIVFLALSSSSDAGSNPDDTIKDPAHSAEPSESQPRLTAEDYPLYRFHGETVQDDYTWISAPEYPDGSYIVLKRGHFTIKHVEFPNDTVLASHNEITDSEGNQVVFMDWSASHDLKYLLLLADYEKGWRHSFFGNYWLYDVEEKRAKPLVASKPDKQIPDEIGSGKVALAVWSPGGHDVAWVRDNDLYVTIGGQTEVRITTDGSKSVVNGIADWVYEEEVLGNNRALWFSPDGSHVAYIKFDDTLVRDYYVQYFAKYDDTPYPKQIDIKYPKPGSPNPTATLHIATPSATGSKGLSVPIDFGDEGFPDNDRIIAEINWVADNNTLLVRLMNRVQDVQKLFIVTSQQVNGSIAWTTALVRDEVTPDGAWHGIMQPLRYLPPSAAVGRKDASYLEIMENADGYAHLAYFGTVHDASPTSWVTSGAWEVTKIVGLNAKLGIVYYLSTEHGSTQRHLYSVHLDGSNKKRLAPHASVAFNPVVPVFNETREATLGDAGFFDASFSPGCEYYLLGYFGPDVPYKALYKTSPSDWTTIVSSYDFHRKALSTILFPPIKYLTIPNAAGDEMNAKMTLPIDFDPSGKTKYPVLMQVYGGPNSQTVQMTYLVDFAHKMALRGFVVVQVDGRGTGFKGRKYRAIVSKHLGLHEVQDQISAAKWLGQQDYVDSKKIAIWGWSYGGFMAAKSVEANSGVFAVGMSVAPVTDWRFYDSVYTERYMKTPALNPEGYATSAVVDMTGFNNAKYLLVHGTADDNVHMQNSAVLVWRLSGEAVPVTQYQVQYYTDSDHSMGANSANLRVYELLESFVSKALDVKAAGNASSGSRHQDTRFKETRPKRDVRVLGQPSGRHARRGMLGSVHAKP